MVAHDEVLRQLDTIGAGIKWWGRAEVRELRHILVPGESIMYCINGRYEGGFAMICITDQRVLLIDKKPLYLTLEDIRYDMVSEVDFSQRLIDATLSIHTLNKTLRFRALKVALLRRATSYVQGRVMEFRHQPHPSQYQTQAAPQQQAVPVQAQAIDQEPQPIIESTVNSLEHRVTNPYTRVPLMMRRRVSRFYS